MRTEEDYILLDPGEPVIIDCEKALRALRVTYSVEEGWQTEAEGEAGEWKRYALVPEKEDK